MTANIDSTCLCCKVVWSVWLAGGRNGLESKAPAGGFLDGVTLTVWKVGSAGFSNVSATNMWSRSRRVELSLPESVLSALLTFLSLQDGVASWAFWSVVKALQSTHSCFITHGSDTCPLS